MIIWNNQIGKHIFLFLNDYFNLIIFWSIYLTLLFLDSKSSSLIFLKHAFFLQAILETLKNIRIHIKNLFEEEKDDYIIKS